MLNPGEALASVLSTMHPRYRLPFLRYLTRKGEWAGNRMYLEEIAAYRDRLASGASRRGSSNAARSRRPALRLVKD